LKAVVLEEGQVIFCVTFNTIDWSLTKDVITIIGTLGALIIGVFGLATWRRQLHGTSKYDVAKRIVLLTYQLGNALQAVRNPMFYLRQEEIVAGGSLEGEQRIYEERMRMVQEKGAELRMLFLEARVIWGEKVNARFDPIKELIGELRAGIWMHFWLKGAYSEPGATVDNNPERVAANNKIVYWTSDDDEFSKRIDATVHQVEEFLLPHIRG
jgi:hypothetical protein